MKYLLVFIAVFALAGCGENARIGVRNVAEIGKSLQDHIDPSVAAKGKVIELEATAAADYQDVGPLGLWVDETKANVTVDDIKADEQAALNKNLEHTALIKEDTNKKITVGGWITAGITGLLGLLGLGGTAAVYINKLRGAIGKYSTTVDSVVKFGVDMTKAETDADAEAVKAKHVEIQKAVGIHDDVKTLVAKAKA